MRCVVGRLGGSDRWGCVWGVKWTGVEGEVCDGGRLGSKVEGCGRLGARGGVKWEMVVGGVRREWTGVEGEVCGGEAGRKW